MDKQNDVIYEQTQLEIRKLRAKEKILEAAAYNAGIWYWNCQWRQNIAYMSERFQKDFNLPEEIPDFCNGIMNYHMIDEKSYTVFKKMCQDIMTGVKEAEATVKGYFPDGSAHWMRFKMSNIFDEAGAAQEAVGIMFLIDDVKEMERKYEIEKRHASEDKDLIAHCCINVNTWEVINCSVGAVLGATAESLTPEMIGQSISDKIINEEYRPLVLHMHDRTFLLDAFSEGKTEYAYEYQKLLADGQCIWVQSAFHMMKDQNNNDILMFEYCYNINVKKTMNILMEFAVNDDYDLMGFVNVQDQKAIMIYGKNSYNPHDTDIVEDDYQDSLMEFAEHAVVADDKERYLRLGNLDQVMENLEVQDNYEFYFSAENRHGEVQSKKIRFIKYGHDERSIIFIQSDITQLVIAEQKNKALLEQALEQARIASSAKTSFLSQMSHEIRTPMNAIIGMTKLAQQTEDRGEITQYLNQIDASSQYLLGIINDILDMSRIESGKLELHPQWIDGCKVVMDCIEMLKPAMDEKHLHFIYPKQMKNSSIRFFLDPMRIQQIYMNLLNNAIKFTPEGGTIALTIKNISHDDHYGLDRIEIRDTGCGMSEAFLERIFEPFEMEKNIFSSQVQGTGLGLALVKAFLTKMGGRIWVESKLGSGSTFTFELPYAAKFEANESAAVITSAEKKISLAGKKILLVDDHPLNREIAKKLLEHEQMKVTSAVDGVDACQLFEQSAVGYFDLILMDIRMPRMDGLEATRQIRKMDRKDAKYVPIIAMTANAFDDDVQKSLDAGMNAHLAKPIEPDQLMTSIENYVNHK